MECFQVPDFSEGGVPEAAHPAPCGGLPTYGDTTKDKDKNTKVEASFIKAPKTKTRLKLTGRPINICALEIETQPQQRARLNSTAGSIPKS